MGVPDRGVRAGVLLPEFPLIRGGEGAVILIVGGGCCGGLEEDGASIGETGRRYIYYKEGIFDNIKKCPYFLLLF